MSRLFYFLSLFFCFLSLHAYAMVAQYDEGPTVLHPATVSVTLPDKNKSAQQPISLTQKSSSNASLVNHENKSLTKKSTSNATSLTNKSASNATSMKKKSKSNATSLTNKSTSNATSSKRKSTSNDTSLTNKSISDATSLIKKSTSNASLNATSFMQKATSNATSLTQKSTTEHRGKRAGTRGSSLAERSRSNKTDRKKRKRPKPRRSKEPLSKHHNLLKQQMSFNQIATKYKQGKLKETKSLWKTIKDIFKHNWDCIKDWWDEQAEKRLLLCLVGNWWDWEGFCQDWEEFTKEEACKEGCEDSNDWIHDCAGNANDEKHCDEGNFLDHCRDGCDEFDSAKTEAWETRGGCNVGCEQNFNQDIREYVLDESADHRVGVCGFVLGDVVTGDAAAARDDIACEDFCSHLCCEGAEFGEPPNSDEEDWTCWWVRWLDEKDIETNGDSIAICDARGSGRD